MAGCGFKKSSAVFKLPSVVINYLEITNHFYMFLSYVLVSTVVCVLGWHAGCCEENSKYLAHTYSTCTGKDLIINGPSRSRVSSMHSKLKQVQHNRQ